MNIKIMDQKKEEVNHSKSFKLVMFSTTPALRAPPPYNRRGGQNQNYLLLCRTPSKICVYGGKDRRVLEAQDRRR